MLCLRVTKQVSSATGSSLSENDGPCLNQFSILETLDGRLRGLCGGDGSGTCSFFGVVGRDQGAADRPKSGLERRFSLVGVGWEVVGGLGTGGGGMRGS